MAQKGIKITYFDGKGRAELARLILAYAGCQYEDKRIGFGDWPAIKSSTPWGCLPIMEFKGTMISQSLAIARCLAREYGLTGKSNIDQSLADSVVEASVDLYAETYKFVFEQDAKTKEEIKKKYIETSAPQLLQYFENFLCNNKTKGAGYIVGDSLTWADLALLNAVDTPIHFGVPLDKYPQLVAHRKRIEATHEIAQYLAKRPKTDF